MDFLIPDTVPADFAPKQNAGFWQTKIARNQARYRLVTRALKGQGWRVLRLQEYEADQTP